MGKYCILLGLFAVVFHVMLDNEKLLKNEMELNTKLQRMVAERDETIHLLVNMMAKTDEELKMKNATIFELKALKMDLEEKLRTKNGTIAELELKVKNCTQVDMKDTYGSWYELSTTLVKDLGIKLAYKLGEILTQVGMKFFLSLLM